MNYLQIEAAICSYLTHINAGYVSIFRMPPAIIVCLADAQEYV